MTWTEASGTYWMAVLIMGVLGYISRRELLWRTPTSAAACTPATPHCPAIIWGRLVWGILGVPAAGVWHPNAGVAGKILHRALTVITDDLPAPGGPMGVVDGFILPLVVEILWTAGMGRMRLISDFPTFAA